MFATMISRCSRHPVEAEGSRQQRTLLCGDVALFNCSSVVFSSPDNLCTWRLSLCFVSSFFSVILLSLCHTTLSQPHLYPRSQLSFFYQFISSLGQSSSGFSVTESVKDARRSKQERERKGKKKGKQYDGRKLEREVRLAYS